MILPTGVSLADYNAAVLNGNQSHVRLVFTTQNVTLTEDNISADYGISLTTVMNPDVSLKFGTATCTELVVHLLNDRNIFNSFDWTDEFHVDFGVDISGTTYWVTVGYFTGSRPERVTGREIIEFTAYDRMKKFDKIADGFLPVLNQMIEDNGYVNLYNVYYALCTYVGVQYTASVETYNPYNLYWIDTNVFKKGMTCRTILGYIAETFAAYAVINEQGKVQLKRYTMPVDENDDPYSYEITNNDYYTIDVADQYTSVIDAVRVYDTNKNKSYIYPTNVSSGNMYYVYNNPLAYGQGGTFDFQSQAGNIYSVLYNFGDPTYSQYMPLKLEAKGNWLIQTGDLLEVYYSHEDGTFDWYTFPVFSRTLVWNSGCIDTLECTGDLTRADEETAVEDNNYESGEYTVHTDTSTKKVYTYEFANGMLVTTIRKKVTVDITSSSGGIYWTSVDGEDFPILYSVQPIVNASTYKSDTNAWVWGNSAPSTSSTGSVYIGRGTSASSKAIWIQWIAVGYKG